MKNPAQLINYNIEEIVLEKIYARSGCTVLNDPQVRVRDLEYAARVLVIELEDFIWAKHEKTIKVKYPKTWWDAFKDRFFDCDKHFFWKRHKPEFVRKKWEVKSLYPTLRLSSEDHTARILIREGL